MTAFLRRQERSGPVLRLAARAHHWAYARGLAEQSAGKSVAPIKARINDRLMGLFRWLDGRTEPDTQLSFGKALAHCLATMELRVYDHELIVGNLSSQRIGAPLHPDYGGALLLPELDRLEKRQTNPIVVSEAQRRELREQILPYWSRRSVLAMTPLYSTNPQLADTLTEGTSFVLTQIAGISHLTPDYPTVLRLGFRGIERRIIDQLDQLADRAPSPHTAEQAGFLRAALICARAAISYGERWRQHLLREAAAEQDAARRAELTALAEVFARVPAQPAETFHEALQSIFTAHVCAHQESFQHGISFGRLDQILAPYYHRDLAAGRITPSRAVALLGCFLGKAAELLPLFFERATEYFSGLSSASGITLGGTDARGRDATNDVSFLVLLAYDQMRLRQPNIHVRVHDKLDGDFKRLCYRVLKKGGGMPALFNDPPIIAAQQRAGVAAEHARDYAVVGCAEWGPAGNCFPAAGAGFINLTYPLQLALHGGRRPQPPGSAPSIATPAAEQLGDMDALLRAYRAQLRGAIHAACEGNNAIETAHGHHRPTPLLSTMVDGCLRAGKDVTRGGAVYNPSGLQGVGLADVADSLAAIEQVVFIAGKLSLAQLVDAVDCDFSGHASLLAYICNRIDKYGNNSGRADHWAQQVSRIYVELVSAQRNRRGGHYSAGLWSMTTHQGFGRRMGALPSGRRAGQPLANGISPQCGWDRSGPTASLATASRVAAVSNGYVLNHKLSPTLAAGCTGDSILDGLIGGFFQLGGMQLQIDVLDPAVLLEARAHAELHRDLVVRISGYSAYFCDLSEQMKDEIIARTLHEQGS